MHPAAFWEQEGDRVHCRLCPHECRIAPGGLGRCGVREAAADGLVATAYARVSSAALDPVEKKPLYHFLPGREIYSIGSAGCNFRCDFCQNWTISQERPRLLNLSPAQAAEQAQAAGACGVAYTYNEPLINFEYVLDCARAVRAAGLVNVLVTNGYVNPEPRAQLLPWIDAWNIDVKSMREAFYAKICGAKLAPVLDTVQAAAATAHVELTYLIITGENDTDAELTDFAAWVASVSPEIPVHFSRYFPQYRRDSPPTPVETLERAVAIAREKLFWVYTGNLRTRDDSTVCPDCRTRLLVRAGFQTQTVAVRDGKCPQCGRRVPGRF